MCYAIPGKIVSISGHKAVIDYFGEKKSAFADCSINIGDYVYAQGGVVVDKIRKVDAKKILSFWKNKFLELEQRDNELAKKIKGSDSFEAIFSKIQNGKPLNRNDVNTILHANPYANGKNVKALRSFANVLRKKKLKNSCCVHGIIEFSNYCRMNCAYCGIRSGAEIKRYRMSEHEIILAAEGAVKLGFKAIVLQSGEDYFYTKEMLTRIVKKIKRMRVLICLSLGERDIKLYKALYNVGAKAVLLRFETSNKELYKRIRPGKRLMDRIALIKKLQKIGYLVSTGFLIGLTGENKDDLIGNIMLSKKLKPDVYSFGPYIETNPNIKCNASLNTCLNTISFVRVLDNNAKILVTTALETLSPQAKKLGLLAGGNSLMIDVTPEKYARFYSLYPGKFMETEKKIKETISLLNSLGRAPIDLGR
ncbi:MAG: radical SAM protein [Candidatus Micrarchaeota archaeon]